MATIAVYSIKGGVGKTAAAVNLAYLCSTGGDRALLWDLDPQSSATFYLRVQPKVPGGGKKLVKKKTDVDDLIRGTDFPGFDLLPGDFSYRKLDVVLSDRDKARKRVSRILQTLGREYETVIVDCAPGLSLVSEALLSAVDLLLIPTIPTPLSLRSLELISDHLNRQEVSRAKASPFFSMVDRRKSLHRNMIDAPPEKPFPFLSSRIPYSSLVEQMGLQRAPLPAYAPSSAAARAFRLLWSEVRGRLSSVGPPAV